MVVLGYPKFKLNPSQQKETLEDYLPFAEIATLPAQLALLPIRCRDIKDEKFIHLAITAKADCLVTGDDDLLIMRDFVPFEMITIYELRTRLM